MKRIILLSVIMVSVRLFGQSDSLAPYLRNPHLPQFSILETDSSTWFTKNDLRKDRKCMIMLFSPDCEHCQKQAEILIQNMDKLKNMEIVMSTYQSMEKMRSFYNRFSLARYNNIHVGRDVRYFFGPYYRLKYSPFLAFYDEQENLVKVYEGGAKIDKIMEAVR